jgi:hypothetical protein
MVGSYAKIVVYQSGISSTPQDAFGVGQFVCS